MLEVYIGPNGYGKTTKLQEIMKELIDNHGIQERDIIFFESELLLLNEMKDTTESTKSMEYILSELIETTPVINARSNFENAVDMEVSNNINSVNMIVDQILQINGQNRTHDFIQISNKKVYKYLVKINQNDVKSKMGSGQRMQLLLELTCRSTKTHVFLDEPEKYSHPSLLHKTSELINNLAVTKNVYIASHSPKLLSMIDIDLDNIKILNDDTYVEKQIDFAGAISKFTAHKSLLSTIPDAAKSYSYFDVISLKDSIKKLHYREFLESIFSKNVYIIEGVNDELFIKKMLQDNGKFFLDYAIFNSYGKHHMMLFAEIFQSMSISTHVYFDKDNNSPLHQSSNNQLSSYNHYMFLNNLEHEFGYTGHKYNTVDFISFLTSIHINSSYDI